MQQLFKKSINIVRPAPTSDTSAGITYPEPTAMIYSGVMASIQPASTAVQNYYAMNHMQVTHTVYTNQALSVNVADQIQYGVRTLVVQGIRNLIESNRVYALDCEETVAN